MVVRDCYSILFPYTTLFRSHAEQEHEEEDVIVEQAALELDAARDEVISLVLDDQAGEQPRKNGVGDLHQERHLQRTGRSEEHTSELQLQSNLVCRLLLEKKN